MWYADGDVYVGKWKSGSYHGGGSLHISESSANRRRPWKGEYAGVEVARFDRGLPSGRGMRWRGDGTVQRLHFDPTRRVKTPLGELTHKQAVRMASKLGVVPPNVRALPPLSDAARASMARADERKEQSQVADRSVLGMGMTSGHAAHNSALQSTEEAPSEHELVPRIV